MRVSFSPMRTDDFLVVVKTGEAFRINGRLFDFSALPDGAHISAGAIRVDGVVSPWFSKNVSRRGGQLDITFVTPNGPQPEQHIAFPEAVTDPPDGRLTIPTDIPAPEDQTEDIPGSWVVDLSEVVFSVVNPSTYQIAKTTPWLRMTDAEGDLVYAAMSETSSRLRAIYDAAAFLSSGDPLWSTMHDILAATLSPARADELLAPEI